MPTKECLWCGQEGDPCTHGTQAALDANQPWVEKADQAMMALAASGQPFTAETLVAMVGLPNAVATHKNNAVGALFQHYATGGLIRRVGYTKARRRSSHRTTLAVWKGR